MNRLIPLLAFPSSLLLAVSFLLAAFALWRYASKSRFVDFMTSAKTGICLLAIGALMLAVEGTWNVALHATWPFAIYLGVLQLSLTLTLLKGLARKAGWGFMANHLGILLIVFGAYFGAPDVTRAKMQLLREWPQNTAYTQEGLTIPLPFRIQLKDFRVDYYDDGVSPKQFTSTLSIGGTEMQTAVNSPCRAEGYTILQSGYDRQEGRYTVLQLVKEPWLPVVYAGMLLMALGAIRMLLGRWKARTTIPVIAVLTIGFTAFSIAKINFGTLMPALRSWWFVPHLFIYMVAYSLMALAVVMRWVEDRRPRLHGTTEGLVRSASGLLILGMLAGAVWARQAWGDYWSWDAKENWAAVTWLTTLVMLHMRHKQSTRAYIILILAFLALQITWYGVNYLPSAKGSLHTYNVSSN